MEKRPLPTALYCRLSREDGDRMESDSIGNQRKLLEAYMENHPELVMADCYADDTAIMGLNRNQRQSDGCLVPFFLFSEDFSNQMRMYQF